MNSPSTSPHPAVPSADNPSHEQVVATTRRWLEKAVIGLNLCPFAKGVHVKDQIRYVVSDARSEDVLLADLERELQALVDTRPEDVDTTLLIHPFVLQNFADFARFLDFIDVVLKVRRLSGVLQVASFHPDYVFADADPDDVANCSNRAPYPTLHLLRESSLDRAVAAFPEAATIYERNIRSLRALGREGWQALAVGAAREET